MRRAPAPFDDVGNSGGQYRGNQGFDAPSVTKALSIGHPDDLPDVFTPNGGKEIRKNPSVFSNKEN